MYGENGGSIIVFSTELADEFNTVDLFGQFRHLRRQFIQSGLIFFGKSEFVKFGKFTTGGMCGFPRLYYPFGGLYLFENRLGGIGVIPEIGPGRFLFEFGYQLFLGIDVKDTSAGFRFSDSIPQSAAVPTVPP